MRITDPRLEEMVSQVNADFAEHFELRIIRSDSSTLVMLLPKHQGLLPEPMFNGSECDAVVLVDGFRMGMRAISTALLPVINEMRSDLDSWKKET